MGRHAHWMSSPLCAQAGNTEKRRWLGCVRGWARRNARKLQLVRVILCSRPSMLASKAQVGCGTVRQQFQRKTSSVS